jgi:hypothetical protein
VLQQQLVEAEVWSYGYDLTRSTRRYGAAGTDSRPKSALWLFFGLVFASMVALVGASCGLAAGRPAHPASIIRSMRRSSG